MGQVVRFAWVLAVVLPACGGGDAPAAVTEVVSAPVGAPPPAGAPSGSTSTAAAAAVTPCPAAVGRVLSVGSGKEYATVRAAAAVAQNGDTVHIAAGDYRGDVATWRASRLTICGVGGRARLHADGVHEGGKGIWVIRGADTTVVNVEFHGARVPDQNGAGIRQEARNLTLRNTGFYDNENGILTDDDSGSTITIEASEFARNGYGDGYTHNLYVGRIGRLHVRGSYFREARIGHQLKTRARENVVEHSYFMDGPDGTSSYLLNFDNGGRAVVRGNLLQKGPRADNSTAVTHYSNIWGADYNSLTMEHNTFVSTYPGGRFVHVNTGAAVTLVGNVFAGTNAPAIVGGVTATSRENLVAAASDFPGATDTAQPNFWPAAALLPRLVPGAPLDTAVTLDAPRPFELRPVTTTARRIGGLQSAP